MTIGLRPECEALYSLVLSHVRWTPDELASSSGWRLSSVETRLAELEDDALVVPSADQPGAWRGVEPRLALPMLAIRRIEQGGDVPEASRLEPFIRLHEMGAQRSARSHATSGLDHASSIVERLVSLARRDVLMTVPRYDAHCYDFCRHINETVIHRGATLRLLWGRDALSTEGREFSHWLVSHGVQPRLTHAMLYRSVIIDREIAVVAEPGQTRILRIPAEVAHVLTNVEAVWQRSDASESSTQPLPLPRRERILRMLAEGNTDDTIARRLGCSVRTVRSEVACTMADLNAKSRFQAGMMASRMGLV